MDVIRVFSAEDLTTLERGYTSDPIDMPASETYGQKEYVLSTEGFDREYNKWDRDTNPMLALNDELSGLEIWLSQPQAERVKKAIGAGKESVDLSPLRPQ